VELANLNFMEYHRLMWSLQTSYLRLSDSGESLQTIDPEVSLLIKLTTIIQNSFVFHHKRGGDC